MIISLYTVILRGTCYVTKKSERVMARIGVTYLEVANAADVIQKRGEEPTVDRIRTQLGTGSRSTLAPLLKTWKSKKGESGTVEGLPADLVGAIKSLHVQTQQLADEKIANAQQTFASDTAKLQSEKAELIAKLKKAEAELQTALDQNRTLKVNLTVAQKECEQRREDNLSLEAKLALTEARLSDIAAVNKELKQENRDIRQHFEHYQMHIAEDRQTERDQFRHTQNSLDAQIVLLQKQVSKLERHNHTVTERSTMLQNQLAETATAMTILQEQHRALTAEQDQWHRAVNFKDQEIQRINATLQIADEKHNALLLTHQSALRQQAALEQKILHTEQRLTELTERTALLDDNNRILMQEKAVLLNQLKQFQQTL